MTKKIRLNGVEVDAKTIYPWIDEMIDSNLLNLLIANSHENPFLRIATQKKIPEPSPFERGFLDRYQDNKRGRK